MVYFCIVLFCLFCLNPNLHGLALCLSLAVEFYFALPVILRMAGRIDLHRGVNPEIVSFLAKELQHFPLHQAVFYNDFSAADRLLDQGYTIAHETDDGQTPLHVAAECGLAAMCKFLLKNSAEVDALDNFGGSPLHAAAACQSGVAVIRILVEKGADIHLKDAAGMTPLALAKKYKHARIAAYLKSLGAGQ